MSNEEQHQQYIARLPPFGMADRLCMTVVGYLKEPEIENGERIRKSNNSERSH